MKGLVAAAGVESFATWLEYWEAFLALPATARAFGVVVTTVALGIMIVGLFPEYGQRSAEKARKHSIASTFIGAIVAGLFLGSVGALWYGSTQSEAVSMLAMPILFVITGIAGVWLLIGVVAIGEFVAAMGGHDNAAWGIATAGVLVGIGAFYPRFGLLILVVAALLGFGSGIRTNPFKASASSRPVPPKRQHP